MDKINNFFDACKMVDFEKPLIINVYKFIVTMTDGQKFIFGVRGENANEAKMDVNDDLQDCIKCTSYNVASVEFVGEDNSIEPSRLIGYVDAKVGDRCNINGVDGCIEKIALGVYGGVGLIYHRGNDGKLYVFNTMHKIKKVTLLMN